MQAESIRSIPVNFFLSTARTGSTLLSTMFNMHPNVVSTSEEPFAFNLYDGYAHIKKWDERIIAEYCKDFILFAEAMLEPQFGSAGLLYKTLLEHRNEMDYALAVRLTYLCFFPEKEKSDIRMIADKQLKYHLHLEKVCRIFPDARFVILMRDPRDNALVRKRKNEKVNRKVTIEKLGITWNKIYSTLLKKSVAIDEKRFIRLKYEDLVSDPETKLKEVCAFFGIEFNPLMLEYDVKVKDEFAKKKEQYSSEVRMKLETFHQGLTQKTYTDKIGFWKQGLTEREASIVWGITEKTALKCGYKPEGITGRKTFTFLLKKLHYFLTHLMVIRIYYAMPFSLRKLLKKWKYGHRLKNIRLGNPQTVKA